MKQSELAASSADRGGMSKELGDRMSVLEAALPVGKVSVKTMVSTRTTNPGRGLQGSDNTVKISGIKNADVDVSRLVLPDGISETGMPGMESLYPGGAPLSKDGGAKWRVQPGRGR